jgi:hypothetical protein
MRAGVDTALARVVSVFGSARSHHAYLFLNRRANRLKVWYMMDLGCGCAHGGCSRDSLSARTRTWVPASS